MKTVAYINLTPKLIIHNGKEIARNISLNDLYHKIAGDYPKFYKMDYLCKLGFLASELLLKEISSELKENASIILFNRNSSLITDRKFQQTIQTGNYFPSPSLFVYTLANIVTGEIAIRHKIMGETSFFILDKNDGIEIERIARNVFLTSDPSFILTGWIDYEDDNSYLADLKILKK